jgi:hypothetical protein
MSFLITADDDDLFQVDVVGLLADPVPENTIMTNNTAAADDDDDADADDDDDTIDDDNTPMDTNDEPPTPQAQTITTPAQPQDAWKAGFLATFDEVLSFYFHTTLSII